MSIKLGTDRLIIESSHGENVEAILKVYQQSSDYLELHTTESPSIEMVQSNLRAATQRGSIFAGICDRQTNELLGIVDFVPKNFRGESDYAWLSVLLIRGSDRRKGFGGEAYRAVEDFIFSDPAVSRIGTMIVPQYEPALRFVEKMGFELAGGPFKNKRGYGLYSFVKKRPGLPETAGEKIWREAKRVMSEE